MNTEQPSSEIVETVLETSSSIPLWFNLLVVAAVACFVFYLYRTERGNSGGLIRAALIILRSALLLLVVWMLAGWTWARFESEKPELVVAIDTSSSMQAADALEVKAQGTVSKRIDFAKNLLRQVDRRTSEELLNRFQIRCFSLAESLQPTASNGLTLPESLQAEGTESRLGESLMQLVQQQAGRGTAAVVFLSDGINTSGTSLKEASQFARRSAIPIFAVGIGKQNTEPDVRLLDLIAEKQLILGDEVVVEALVLSNDLDQAKSTVELVDAKSGEVLDTSAIELSKETPQQPVRLRFTPKQPGVRELLVRVQPLEVEADKQNNELPFEVEIENRSIRVLMVFGEATYEFRFLKNFLERSRQRGVNGSGGESSASFDLISVLQDADAAYVSQDVSARRLVPSDVETLQSIDVFVFAGVNPSNLTRSTQRRIVEAVVVGGAGCLFIDPTGDTVSGLSTWPLGELLPVDSDRENGGLSSSEGFMWRPTSVGINALPLQLENTLEESLAVWNTLPGSSQLATFGELKLGASVLVEGVSNSGQVPLLITQFGGAGRIAIQATDETYRWVSFGGNDLYHQRYWGQLLRWLGRGKLGSANTQDSLVVRPKRANVGQRVDFSAVIVSTESERGKPIVTILDDKEFVRRVELRPLRIGSSDFVANLDDLPAGNYRAFLGSVLEDSEAQQFSITAPPGEQASLRVDRDALEELASVSRGKLYSMENAEELFKELPKGRPTRIGSLPRVPLWNSWWVAVLFVGLLTAEWMLRRRVRMV